MEKDKSSGRKSSPVTINDIARLAKVSKKTVSRVINDSPLVRDETRRRVQAVIQEHGYVPDTQARALAFGRSFLIGLIYDNPSPQYVVNMQRGVLDVLGETPFELVLHPCDRQDTDVASKIKLFVARQKPAGVILTPSVSEDDHCAEILREADCPYVRIASVHLDDAPHMLRTQDARGAALAARHLAELGHTKIAHVHGPKSFRSSHQRLTGFEVGLNEFGLNLAPENILEGAYTYDSGVECARRLIARKDRPTAIFAGNDEMALGVYHTAREHGLVVPDDLSIVGYDDTPMAARIWPPLTSVRTDIRGMGRAATRQLLRLQIEATDDVDDSEFQHDAPELIVRQSSAPPKP